MISRRSLFGALASVGASFLPRPQQRCGIDLSKDLVEQFSSLKPLMLAYVIDSPVYESVLSVHLIPELIAELNRIIYPRVVVDDGLNYTHLTVRHLSTEDIGRGDVEFVDIYSQGGGTLHVSVYCYSKCISRTFEARIA